MAPSALSPDDLLGGILGGGLCVGGSGVGNPLPLPKGSRYPQVGMDSLGDASSWPGPGKEPLAAASKARAAAHLTSHREQLIELHSVAERLAQEEARFRQQQEELLTADDERRTVAQVEEERLLEERRQLDEELNQKRLQQVRQLYEGMEKQLVQQQKARAVDGQQVLDDLRRRHRQRAYDLEARLKDEAVINLEAKGAQAVAELLRKRREEEARRALQAEVRSRRRALELQDEVQRQQWLVDDERERARLEALRERRLRQDAKEAEMRQRRQVEMELRLEELERQLKLSQISRERVLRKAREDAALAQETVEEQQRRRHEVAARNERRQQAISIAEERRRQRQNLLEQERLVQKETQRWREELDRRDEELNDAALEALRKDYALRQQEAQEEELLRGADEENQIKKTLTGVKGLARNDMSEGRSEVIREPAAAASNEPAAEPLAREPVTFAPGSGFLVGSGAACGSRSAPKRDAQQEPSAAAQDFENDDALQSKEGQLDALIRQREAELEALWREFDTEAREISQEDEAFTALSSGAFETARAFGTNTGSSRRPLGGSWDDASEESSPRLHGFTGHGRGGSGGLNEPLSTVSDFDRRFATASESEGF
eukprot:TRINITY_DN30384_c0_g1_i1.p1 TRINITY_DN30384_c0_g1~~TRINITY_DN30384_c0_g1_i1.p1  ORF type:complete len:687 (+),score=197.66 TRINITY_DN30384_c0_g1_i1:239-2062(+)